MNIDQVLKKLIINEVPNKASLEDFVRIEEVSSVSQFPKRNLTAAETQVMHDSWIN